MGYINVTSEGVFTYTEGWEDDGARAVDIPTQPAAEVEADVQRAVKLVNDRLKGAHVVAAIGALHGQHTRDGRPARYVPEAR